MSNKHLFKKLATVVIALAMILVAIPTMEAKAAQNVKVHFKNTENWSSVYVYSWIGSEPIIGSWPGTDITATGDANGYYTATLDGFTEDSLNIIFSDGNGTQTADLVCDITQGTEWWVVLTDNTGKWNATVATSKADAESGKSSVSTPTEDEIKIPENPTVKLSPVIKGNKVTFYFEAENVSQVEVFGSMNDWAEGYKMQKDGNVFSYTCTLEDGTYQYKYVVNGGIWMTDPFNAQTADDGTGNMNSSFTVASGSSSNDTTGSLTPENPTVTVSPVIDGNKVTFYYESETAKQVEVFGNMNDWAAGLLMEKDGNVFSYTCELAKGSYQYKYVVDGESWIMDPFNAQTADDGTGNMNSAFEITAELSEGTTEDAVTENTEAVADTEVETEGTEPDTSVADTTPAKSSLPTGVTIVIATIVTIVVALGAFFGYTFYKNRNK